MKYQITLALIVLAAIFSLSQAQSNTNCNRPNGAWCTRSEQCSSGYCRTATTRRCDTYGTRPEDNKCSVVKCANGPCLLRDKTCVTTPCEPSAECVQQSQYC